MGMRHFGTFLKVWWRFFVFLLKKLVIIVFLWMTENYVIFEDLFCQMFLRWDVLQRFYVVLPK